ncbi:MAG TPA: hypothetical protein PKK95_11915 [Vicinamibacterales bacterium]|nr:hypothetical protein [Vicinamibacterales bacterium]
MDQTPRTAAVVADPSDITWTHVIYALHAFGVVLGVATSAAIVTSFLFGLPSIVAVIINYVRRSRVRGTFLESHFRWQIRTFWYALGWIVLATVVSVPLMLDRNQDAITAMLASFGALLNNPGPMLVWAALIVILTAIGFATFNIGLVVLMPIIGHATWHAYRDLIEPLPPR